VDPALIFPMIAEHRVTHMCGAPTVLSLLTSAPAEQRRGFGHVVDIQTGGSPPPAKVIKGMEELGFRVTHIYGMTELQGPSTLCVPQDGWDKLPLEQRGPIRNGAKLLAPLCSSRRAQTRAPTRSSRFAAISSRISRRPNRWCSERCRPPRPARSRNSSCASALAPLPGDQVSGIRYQVSRISIATEPLV